MTKDTGGPAFQHIETLPMTGSPYLAGGMTLRDFFAGQALIPYVRFSLSELPEKGDTVHTAVERYARSAYLIADAMIAERNKP